MHPASNALTNQIVLILLCYAIALVMIFSSVQVVGFFVLCGSKSTGEVRACVWVKVGLGVSVSEVFSGEKGGSLHCIEFTQ